MKKVALLILEDKALNEGQGTLSDKKALQIQGRVSLQPIATF